MNGGRRSYDRRPFFGIDFSPESSYIPYIMNKQYLAKTSNNVKKSLLSVWNERYGEKVCKIADELFFEVDNPKRGLLNSDLLSDSLLTLTEKESTL